MIYRLEDVSACHDHYEKLVRSIEDDLRYWDHFVNKWAIPEYQKTHDNHRVFESAYAVYDINVPHTSARLKSSPVTVQFNSDDLYRHSHAFFGWLYNMAVVRAYNGMEILLYRLINVCFIAIPNNRASSNSEIKKIFSAIQQELGKVDKTNNQFLLDYLVSKSSNYDTFLPMPIRVGDPTAWLDFFYLISVLRHTIVHNSMIITSDTLNAIKSHNCYTTFQLYYDLNRISDKEFSMQPKQDRFLNLTSLITEFSVNTLKIICDQSDLKFLGLK